MKKLIPALITLKQRLDNGKIYIPVEIVPHNPDITLQYEGIPLPIKVCNGEATLAVRED